MRAYEAISNGLIAVGSGDIAAARKLAAEVNRIAPGEPLALLLAAQSAQLSGDREAAERAFRAMASRADTKALGLHGLYVEAQRRDDLASARAYAEEAARTAPALGWAEPGGAGIPLRRRRLGRRARASRARQERARQGCLPPPARSDADCPRACRRRFRPRRRQSLCARSGQAGADFGAGGGARRAHARRGRRAAQSLAHRRQKPGAPIRIPIWRRPMPSCASATPRATGSTASKRWPKKRPARSKARWRLRAPRSMRGNSARHAPRLRLISRRRPSASRS